MNITDPIADMLTRIRNANTVGHKTVEIPASNIKKSIAGILLEEGYINGFEVIEDEKQIKKFYEYLADISSCREYLRLSDSYVVVVFRFSECHIYLSSFFTRSM